MKKLMMLMGSLFFLYSFSNAWAEDEATKIPPVDSKVVPTPIPRTDDMPMIQPTPIPKVEEPSVFDKTNEDDVDNNPVENKTDDPSDESSVEQEKLDEDQAKNINESQKDLQNPQIPSASGSPVFVSPPVTLTK